MCGTLTTNCVVLCRQLCVVSGGKSGVEKYSSVGLDGAMVIWDFKVYVNNSSVNTERHAHA